MNACCIVRVVVKLWLPSRQEEALAGRETVARLIFGEVDAKHIPPGRCTNSSELQSWHTTLIFRTAQREWCGSCLLPRVCALSTPCCGHHCENFWFSLAMCILYPAYFQAMVCGQTGRGAGCRARTVRCACVKAVHGWESKYCGRSRNPASTVSFFFCGFPLVTRFLNVVRVYQV